MKTPHSRQMSLGVGHQFTDQFGLNVDYVRQHMDNLYVQRNPNYLDKTVTPNRRHLTANYGDIVLWDDIGQVRLLGVPDAGDVAAEQDARQPRVHARLVRGELRYRRRCRTTRMQFLFNRQRTSGDERHRFVLSEVSPIPFGFMLSSITTLASPRPFVATDGRDINLDNITGDDYLGGTVGATGNRTVLPANSCRNWYRTVDLRLARPLYSRQGQDRQPLGRGVQPVQLAQQPVVRVHSVLGDRRATAVVRQCRRRLCRPPGAGRHEGRLVRNL